MFNNYNSRINSRINPRMYAQLLNAQEQRRNQEYMDEYYAPPSSLHQTHQTTNIQDDLNYYQQYLEKEKRKREEAEAKAEAKRRAEAEAKRRAEAIPITMPVSRPETEYEQGQRLGTIQRFRESFDEADRQAKLRAIAERQRAEAKARFEAANAERQRDEAERRRMFGQQQAEKIWSDAQRRRQERRNEWNPYEESKPTQSEPETTQSYPESESQRRVEEVESKTRSRSRSPLREQIDIDTRERIIQAEQLCSPRLIMKAKCKDYKQVFIRGAKECALDKFDDLRVKGHDNEYQHIKETYQNFLKAKQEKDADCGSRR
jgi:hypothetical protein